MTESTMDDGSPAPVGGDNTDIIRAIYACFGGGDMAGLMARLHQDVDWVWNGPAAIPYAGGHRGHIGVGAFFCCVATTVEVERFAPRQFVTEGETVVVLGDEKVRVKATGLSFATGWVHVWTVRVGKVARLRAFADTATMAAAFHP